MGRFVGPVVGMASATLPKVREAAKARVAVLVKIVLSCMMSVFARCRIWRMKPELERKIVPTLRGAF